MDNKKIILVEDEVFISDIYKRMLEKAGYLVLTAYDGEAGLQMIRDNTDVSLVLLDIMLPKMHGLDILRLVKADEKTKHITIVMLSNLGEEDIMNESLAKGAHDYLKKVNITPQQLVVCVTSYLNDPQYTYKQ